eukprot:TRINITY_DN583_c0_g1_i2.p3 TRINITY_DN583_c0_g1~~TRINITY_DN583_c0_g1_i2.p3  ORF type:complete len:150 (+),score=17.61 TRINITY_DN583_c0_g1_i2:568-1017(+)
MRVRLRCVHARCAGLCGQWRRRGCTDKTAGASASFAHVGFGGCGVRTRVDARACEGGGGSAGIGAALSAWLLRVPPHRRYLGHIPDARNLLGQSSLVADAVASVPPKRPGLPPPPAALPDHLCRPSLMFTQSAAERRVRVANRHTSRLE